MSNQESKFDFLATRQCLVKIDRGTTKNKNMSNQESKFNFLATRQCLVKIDKGQQKIKIVRTNRQSNLLCSCQSRHWRIHLIPDWIYFYCPGTTLAVVDIVMAIILPKFSAWFTRVVPAEGEN